MVDHNTVNCVFTVYLLCIAMYYYVFRTRSHVSPTHSLCNYLMKVAQFYIDMNYRQALIWTAIPYLPFAPLYAFVTQNIMFYVMMHTFGAYYKAGLITQF